MHHQGNSAVYGKIQDLFPFLFNKSHKTHIQLLRYAVVGGCAYAVDFGTLYLMTDYLQIHYLISAAAAFTLGLFTNYTLSILWVFSKRAVSQRHMEFLIFAVIGVAGLGFNEVFLWFFTEFVQFHYLVSKLVSTVFVFFWNFFARKKILFS
ncbi:MAG: GtrA family protein [Candidatus Aminicenantes bacterium]